MQRACIKKEISVEAFICLLFIVLFFYLFTRKMGFVNMLSTMMNTAYSLMMETVLYIVAIAVLAGALSAILSEFGVVSLFNRILSPLMRPLYGLPGAAVLGIITTYLSDNPAILTLTDDTNFRRYFKKYQLPALTNLGTAFGMGLIITTYMLSLYKDNTSELLVAVLVGNFGAVIGSIVSTRIMLIFTSKMFTRDPWCDLPNGPVEMKQNERYVRNGSTGMRLINALLDGGKSGVQMGISIIPGVLIICTIVMMLTNGASTDEIYTGGAYEGIALLPQIAKKLNFLLRPLFGFSSAQCISVPITALGAAGAAIGVVPQLLKTGLVNAHDIAVFTAMCMCWSGFLSTHVSMMDRLGCNVLTGKAIVSHTIGGIAAGIAANWVYIAIIAIV
jgi:hypothetical protein